MRRLESASPAYTIAADRYHTAWETLVIMHHALDKVCELDSREAALAAGCLWQAALLEYQHAANDYRQQAREQRARPGEER